MHSRERFQATMQFTQVDRPPLFEEGLRDEVIEIWRAQGMAGELGQLFHYDQREEIELNLDPDPELSSWPTSPAEMAEFVDRLNPDDPARLPERWSERMRAWRQRTHVLMLRVHRGFFLSLGVHGWDRFREAIVLTVDQPDLVREMLEIQGRFAARLAQRMLAQLSLQEVEIDAAIFSEPIGGNHGPLISPRMYRDFVIPSYQPLLAVLQRAGVQTLIVRTYANTRVLLPALVDAGFNCLWACECPPEAMDYTALRREFGTHLRLIGGIDSDLLRGSPAELQREIATRLPPLLAQGGFIPLADGRVRDDVPYRNYLFYRKLLEKIVTA
jgi:uroporphyrinogen decarboxylase